MGPPVSRATRQGLTQCARSLVMDKYCAEFPGHREGRSSQLMGSHMNNLHTGHPGLVHPRRVSPSQEAKALGPSSMKEPFKMAPSQQAPPDPSLSPTQMCVICPARNGEGRCFTSVPKAQFFKLTLKQKLRYQRESGCTPFQSI